MHARHEEWGLHKYVELDANELTEQDTYCEEGTKDDWGTNYTKEEEEFSAVWR